MLYFMKGFLPWQGITASDKDKKYQKILDMKMKTPTDVLCKGLPCTSGGHSRRVQEDGELFEERSVRQRAGLHAHQEAAEGHV